MKLLFPFLCEASTVWTRIAGGVTRRPDLQIAAAFGRHPVAERRRQLPKLAARTRPGALWEEREGNS